MYTEYSTSNKDALDAEMRAAGARGDTAEDNRKHMEESQRLRRIMRGEY